MHPRWFALAALLTLPIAACGTAPPPQPTDATAAEPKPAQAATEATASADETASRPAAQDKPAATEGETPPSGVNKATVVSEPLGGGYLTQTEIRAIVMKNGELFNDCYTIGAGKSQQFVATVTVKATIGPGGTVQITEITKSTANNKKVDTCVSDAFKKIKFPAPKGAATAVITFPMEFQGAEEVK